MTGFIELDDEVHDCASQFNVTYSLTSTVMLSLLLLGSGF
jgi:hypothetical protein